MIGRITKRNSVVGKLKMPDKPILWETLLPMTLRACQTGKHAELILVLTTCNYGLLVQVLIIRLTKEFSPTKNYHNVTASPPIGRSLVSNVPASYVDGMFGKLSLSQLPSLICRSQYTSYSLSLRSDPSW
jgi:hypothetical protein